MGRSDKGDVDLLASQHFEQFPAKALFQANGYERIGFTKRTNGTRHERVKWTRGHNADADLALLAARRAPCRFKRMIELSKDRAGIVEESVPGSGQLDAARLSVKELRIKLALDRLDALAERRLLHAKPLGGTRDVPFLGDGDEIPKVPELHSVYLHVI